MHNITEQQFSKAIYPKQNNRFMIAIMIVIPILIIIVLFFLNFFIFSLLTILIVWLVVIIYKVKLTGNSIKVSNKNFPEIHEIYLEVKNELSYDKGISIYIINEGTVNAFLAKYFNTRLIILHAELVTGMVDKNQMKWVISRFIGALKAKHNDIGSFRLLIENIEDLKILNLFILPYERATQYTGDNIGMLVTGNLEQSINAFNRFIIGNSLSKKINFEGIIEQGLELNSNKFLSLITRVFSSHPHIVDRYLNLLGYAKKEFPSQFNEFIKNHNAETIRKINSLIVNY